MKQLMTLTLLLFPLITFSQPRYTPNHFSSDGDMGYEADGLDMWDLNGQDPAVALQNFKNKCDTEIPARIAARFPQTGLDVNDFTFIRRIDQYYINGYGTSYRCYIHSYVKDHAKYKFTPWQATDFYYDIRDNQGNITKTAVQQCQEKVEEIEFSTEDTKLFDRHALYVWAKDRAGVPYVASCYVTYINLVTKR